MNSFSSTVPPRVNSLPRRGHSRHFALSVAGVRARAMMINCGWNKCAFEQSRHLWVSSWILPVVSRILFDPVIPIDLSLDGHSCWVITRAAPLCKQIDLVIRDDGGRLYDREKANLSPLCNKTAATSPNVCSIEGKRELLMSCYFKIPKRCILPLLVT